MADELILNHEDPSNLHRHYINLTCVNSGEYAEASNGGKPTRQEHDIDRNLIARRLRPERRPASGLEPTHPALLCIDAD